MIEPTFVSPSDLLPVIFEQLVKEFTRVDILKANRQAILIALITSLRIAGEASAEEGLKNSNKKEVSKNVAEEFTLHTSDRFCTKWVPRVDILERIRSMSDLNQRMAHLALLLMEARTDIMLNTSPSVRIDGIGTISYNSLAAPNPNESSGIDTLWCDRVFSQLSLFPSSPAPSMWYRLFRKPSSSSMIRLVEYLELSTIFRKPHTYKIYLSSDTRMELERFRTEIAFKQ